jgi:hypothetical protein
MSSGPETSSQGREDWRLKILTDAIGNALGTGLAGAVGLLYANAIGLITVNRRVVVGAIVLIVAILWNIAVWYAWDVVAKRSSRFRANLLVFGGGQALAFVVLGGILASAGQSVQPVFLAMLLGLCIVTALQLLQASRGG